MNLQSAQTIPNLLNRINIPDHLSKLLYSKFPLYLPSEPLKPNKSKKATSIIDKTFLSL